MKNSTLPPKPLPRTGHMPLVHRDRPTRTLAGSVKLEKTEAAFWFARCFGRGGQEVPEPSQAKEDCDV